MKLNKKQKEELGWVGRFWVISCAAYLDNDETLQFKPWVIILIVVITVAILVAHI